MEPLTISGLATVAHSTPSGSPLYTVICPQNVDILDPGVYPFCNHNALYFSFPVVPIYSHPASLWILRVHISSPSSSGCFCCHSSDASLGQLSVLVVEIN